MFLIRNGLWLFFQITNYFFPFKHSILHLKILEHKSVKEIFNIIIKTDFFILKRR